MDFLDVIRELKTPNDSKLVLLVADGIGGLPCEPGGPTELEAAHTPNLDRLAKRGVLGTMIPIKPGITPGSGPGHLGLFGLDPLRYVIGRGVLEATGIGFQVGPNDVAVRCNFVTLNPDRTIKDRRAGRIPTAESAPLAKRLRQVQIPGVEVFVEPVQEHRFAVIFRPRGWANGSTTPIRKRPACRPWSRWARTRPASARRKSPGSSSPRPRIS